ncbi:hypothetical protein SLEP1_g38147 [Rubroshorea leprosula]|uniref:Uncharacterized protein n=1 Tax=Rubroshorea leprosula TaxID=152421 RepID=A0AAV5KXI9_9ROSI|nr:hypothetical protein SLEP1_g38147 [Rubroshorea leprosula]
MRETVRERGSERGWAPDSRRRSRTRWTALGREFSRSRGRSRQRRSAAAWQRDQNMYQNHSTYKEGGYDRGIYKQATAFFFTNFPKEWNYEDMWKTFGKYGRIFAIYSPERRSRNGGRFGFVRFLDVKNSKDLERQLDQIRVEGRKIWVNLAKYPEEERPRQKHQVGLNTATIDQERTFADVVKGKQGVNMGNTRVEPKERIELNALGKDKSRMRNGREDQRQVWKIKNREEEWNGIEYKVQEGDYEWLQGCYVGTAHSVQIVPNLQEKFFMEGFFSCRLRAMGGKLVLMDCVDKEELKDLVQNGADWLSQWFSEVRPWTPAIVAKESKKRRFDIARFLISTECMDPISVQKAVKVNGDLYTLKFIEEELTNILFSLRQDFMPNFLSESEHEDSWSLSSSDYGNNQQDVEEDKTQKQSELINSEEDDGRKSRRCRREAKGGAILVDSEVELASDKRSFSAGGINEGYGNSQSLLKDVETVEGVADSIDDGVKTDGTVDSRKDGLHGGGLNSKIDSQIIESEEADKEYVGQGAEHSNWRTGLCLKRPNGKGVARACEEKSANSWVGAEPREENGPREEVMPGKKQKEDLKSKAENSNTFWEGFESEEGSEKEWMGRTTQRDKKRRRKRAKSCSLVYQKTTKLGQFHQKKRGRGRSNSRETKGEVIPEFLPGTSNSVAGGSIGDSGIENCNRLLKTQPSRKIAEDLWDFAKQLGVIAENEEVMIKNLEEMENRDRKAKAASLDKKETKMGMIDKRACRSVWGIDEVDWVAKNAEGMSGGILCVWNPSTLKKKRVLEGEYCIGIEGVWGTEEVLVCIINVYSPCQIMGKRALWIELKNMVTGGGSMWCVVGDFNAIRRIEERWGCRSVSTEMREFDYFIQESELIDLPLAGRKFTWYHSNGNQMSRIDRFLLSEGWLSKWCDTKQWGLTRTVSDHCPIMLKVNKMNWGPKPFKFFDAWLDDQGCRELISEGEQGQLTEEEINKRKEALLDIWKNMNTKERMAQQKSRKTWLVNGDANTKFFHNCVKGKWRITEMNSIQIKDSQLVEPTIMKEEIANFFENMFKEENYERPKLEGISFQQITEQENASLVAPFSEDEIKAAVWDCECSKAPGPDGFNFRFVRREWETIKGDVIGFIKEFQEKGKLVRGLNSSFIVLVPKVNNPQRIEEYRPISLIGAVYKILAKLLANRLKKVLDQVIGKQQMAFISGRQLMDGVVIANEVVDEAKKKKRKSFLFKIDFEKAYDKACWKFLDCMMQKLGFYATWRRWIMECLRTSQVSVLVNGSPTRQFNISQGLRQGDPLSPFLFLIVAEGLNGMITTAVQKGLLEGVEVGSKGFKISHLQFADDTILFGSATEQNVWAMKGIMRSFELVSSLKVNFNKSQLLGIAVNEEWLDKMAWVLCCRKDGKYSTRSAYKVLTMEPDGEQRHSILKRTWNPIVPSKIAAFSWQLIQDKIPTKGNLLRRGVIQDPAENCWGVFEQHSFLLKTEAMKEGWECIWFAMVWTIWLARNEQIFTGKAQKEGRLFELIQLRAFHWLKGRRGEGIKKGGYGILEGLSICESRHGRGIDTLLGCRHQTEELSQISDTDMVSTHYIGVDTERKGFLTIPLLSN